jgi:hypothetical protein
MGVHRHRLGPPHVRVEVVNFGWFVFETNHPRDELAIDGGVVGDDGEVGDDAVEVVGRPSRPPRSITPNLLVKRVCEKTVSI